MSLFSPAFLGLSLLFVLLFRLQSHNIGKSAVLLGANLLFLVGVFASPIGALPLAGFLLLGFCAIKTVQRHPSRLLCWTWVTVIVALFIWLQGYALAAFLPEVPIVFSTLGLSYILFRILHMIYDGVEETLEYEVPLVDYLNYTTHFLAFVSGPIDRYQSFKANFLSPIPAQTPMIRATLVRIVKGYAKVLILAASALYVFDNVTPQLFAQDSVALPKMVLLFSVAAACYTFYLYMNFSGYMDIVIGIARLAGLELPENFNRPFLSRSMLEFWSRWHMTLSNWFKQYAFNPIMAALLTRWPSSGMAPFFGVLTFFFVFTVLGIWHGTTPIFIAYGLMLGFGVSINKLWQVALTARLGHKGMRALAANPLYTYAARGLTIGFFAIALLAFWMDMSDLVAITREFGVVGWLMALAVLSFGWIICVAFQDLITARSRWTFEWAKAPALVSYASMAAVIYMCITTQTILNKGAGFVYADF